MSDEHGSIGKGMGKKFLDRSVELFPIIDCDYAAWYIRFKKMGDGEKLVTTEIKLSSEAMTALVSLHREITDMQRRNQVIDSVMDLDQEPAES